MTSQFDEFSGEPVLFGFPCQIKRINRDTVSAEAWAGIKGIKPKGLVFAASMTSQMLISIFEKMTFNSLTSAMFTKPENVRAIYCFGRR